MGKGISTHGRERGKAEDLDRTFWGNTKHVRMAASIEYVKSDETG